MCVCGCAQILRFEVGQLTRRVTSLEYIKELILSQLMNEQQGGIPHDMAARRSMTSELGAWRAQMVNEHQMIRGLPSELDARRKMANEQMLREEYDASYAAIEAQQSIADELEARRRMTPRTMNSGEMFAQPHMPLNRGSASFNAMHGIPTSKGPSIGDPNAFNDIHKLMSEKRKAPLTDMHSADTRRH